MDRDHACGIDTLQSCTTRLGRAPFTRQSRSPCPQQLATRLESHCRTETGFPPSHEHVSPEKYHLTIARLLTVLAVVPSTGFDSDDDAE